MSGSAGSIAYKTAFQLSPLVMTGGLAQDIPGGMLPIIALTQGLSFAAGLLAGGSDIDLDEFFANFHPVAGATLIDQQIGSYPFANQAVAANATIAQPLQLSMLMICPARGPLGYAVKLATMMMLIAAVQQHIQMGGTWTILTPSYFYPNGILTGLRDVSGGESKQAQAVWQWEFVFPLLTLNQAQAAQNSLMSKLGSGTQIDGQPTTTGLGAASSDPGSVASPSLIPASTNTPAANVAPLPGAGGGTGGADFFIDNPSPPGIMGAP